MWFLFYIKLQLPIPKKYIIYDLVEIDDIDPYRSNTPIPASPLVQVFSISVDTNFNDDRPCQLYGSIRVTEGEGTTFSLYDRNHDNPETIMKHSKLSLIGPQSNDLSCSLGTTKTKIEFNLMDETRNIEFIKARLNLDSNTEEIENSYDKLKTAVVGAEHGNGYASVYYAMFRFAAFAVVETAIFAKYDESRPYSKIYGTIVAGYANSKSYNFRRDDELSSMKCTLFNKSPDEPVLAAIATPLSLSRYVVAVPMHSSLKVEAHLWDCYTSQDGPFASGSVEFLGPHNACNKLIFGAGGSVVVSVTWDNAFERVYAAEELRDYTYDIDETIAGDAQEQNLMLQNKPLPSSTRALSKCKLWGKELIEVLSIFVESEVSEVPVLCGSVKVEDFFHFCIFDHDISDPEFCSADKRMVSVGGDRTFSFAGYFDITFYLKDPVSDVVISNGVVYKQHNQKFPWYDKRLCSVIQGAHGYAVMHYIVFCNACTALVVMKIVSSDVENRISARTASPINIYGCVLARYKSHDYSSIYDRIHYQIRLFDRPESEPVELTTESKLPLLKSAVSVPMDDSLVIEASLCATSNTDPKEEVVFGTVEFEVDDNYCTIHKRIQGHHYCIQISVETC